jgi:hypothetical protein
MDVNLQFLQDNDGGIIDAETVVSFDGVESELAIKITLDDNWNVITLTKSELEQMLECLNED